ncbi:MAG: class I SAM-dependent methyltransferase [Opitutales bacterium]
MERDRRAHWLETGTALHYARAAARVGLWASERVMIERHFRREHRLLEVGAGAGRAGLGLLRLGFTDLVITDFSPAMVEMARGVLAEAGPGWEDKVRPADMTGLPFPDGAFDGVLAAFNALMCLRGRADREKALAEIRRVLRPGGRLVFSANDRERGDNREAWARHAPEDGLEPGERWHDSPTSPVFMRSCTEEEMREELEAAGLRAVGSALSSELAEDGPAVRAFAGVTRLYAAERP